MIETDLAGKKACKSIFFMTGKIYHDVAASLQGQDSLSGRLVRIEELYPFPAAEIARIAKESGAENVYWVQEEPQNMGAWSYVEPRLRDATGKGPVYIGRPASAATATGSGKHHALEQKAILTVVAERLTKA